ncbi:P1 family peptidase [Micromonospora sp. 4G57]|uniref:P1 family peptidase n=1 Tax=Micromonospora sicca TaxID=2202420 RepID=A0ABU5JM36_9ACTN|nr:MULTISPECIES: P1 family peptidase [unclassified Micromonospora]MDZ5446969.1 P1 family peptidase [Micromonospora sp. 4G57]MDZ5493646.1 P1 family peptidase [Micromonospora sp. 4G53]
MTAPVRPGPSNTLTDVAGVRVGHHQRTGGGWLTGTTVVVAPAGGAVAGVDVRGGGPGTHETDVLDARNLVDRVHAILLGGGSAYGLAAVAGVVDRLADAGIGFPVGTEPGQVVPIVPAAVLFDLGRGGDFRATPGPDFGSAAYDAATDGQVALGTVGAGTGAVAGGIKGGVGSASAVVGGVTVGALAVVNAVGSTVDPATGELYGARFGLAGEFDGARPPNQRERAAALEAAEAPAAAAGRGVDRSFHTTIGVLATDATLTKAQCQKLAGIGHDGMARAIRPVHSMFDGDTVFALATCAGPALDPVAFNAVLAAAADAFTRAVVHGILAAGSAGGYRAYADIFPSAVQEWRRR